MKDFWRALFGRRGAQDAREHRRDPDLDLVKHMTENHEHRLQLLEKDLDAVSGGREPYRERRQTPRH